MMNEKEIREELLVLYLQLRMSGSCSTPKYIDCTDCILADSDCICFFKYISDKVTGFQVVHDLYIQFGGTSKEFKEYIVEHMI